MTDFQFTSPDGRLTIVAVSDEAQNLVTYQVTADVTGYIGIGFSDADNNRFHNSPVDGFMVAVVDGEGVLADVTSSTTPSVVVDDDNGDYELVESAEVDGTTSFTVERSLTPDDNQDFPLVVGEDFNLFYALSDNDNLAVAHADGGDDRNFFTAAADGGVVLAGFELDPGLGLLLSVVIPLALLSLFKLFMEFDKGTLREYKVIDRTPAGRVMNTIKRISQRISGGRNPASQGDTLPVVSSHSHPSMDGRPAAASGGRPESLTQRLSMAFGAAKEKLVTVNYSPKSLNNTGCLAELKHFSRVRVSKEMTVFQLFMIMLFTGIALFWVYGEPVEGFLVADAWGYVCISSALLVIIPATRNSLLTYFLMAPFERTIAYHRWLGTFVFIAGAAHTIYYLVEWQQLGILEANLQVEKYQRGFIAMGGLTIVFLTSLGCVRRKAYSFFRIAHYAFFVFFIAGVAHTNTFLVYAALAGVIYFSDIFLRYAFDLSPKQAFALDVLPGDVTRIRFPKSAFKSYAAGQYVFINMPAISRSEWHPFTLSSGPHQDYLEVHIKALGDFTSTLLSAAQNMNSMKQLPKLRVDGPYGRISFNYKRYENIVLIGGGVGVTPMMSVLKDLFQIDVSEVNRRRHPISPYVKNVYFLWVVPSVAPWAWFFDTLKVAMETSKKGSALGYPKLRVKGFCTRPDPKLAGLQNAVAKVKNYTVTEGRPDMENLLDGVEGSIGVGRKRVAVLACGPTALVSSAWDSCLRRSRPGIQFDCHREEFDF